jgi:hypothetical protein
MPRRVSSLLIRNAELAANLTAGFEALRQKAL